MIYKATRYKTIIFFALIVAGFLFLGAWYVAILHNPLRQSQAGLRRMLLKETPLGSNMNDVEAFLIKKGFKINKSIDAGLYVQFPHGHTIGEKSIWCIAGVDEPWPIKINQTGIDVIDSFLYYPMTVSFAWAFDKEGRLIEVVVEKNYEAP